MNEINKGMTIHIIPEHVKGHHDDNCDYKELDCLLQINMYMDWNAKEILKRIHNNEEINVEIHEPHLFSFQIISVNNIPIYHRVTKELHRHITDQ